MPVSTNSLTMVRIVRSPRLGYWAQSWYRTPGSAWRCRHERHTLTLPGAMRVVRRWPGPLTVEAHQVREISALTPPPDR